MSAPPNEFAQEILRSSAHALASDAALRMLERDPGVSDRWGPPAFAHWVENIESRLAILAAALGSGEPDALGRSIAWARVAFGSRNAPEHDLRLSLECLRGVLDANLPPLARDAALGALDDALAEFDAPSAEPPSFLSVETPHGQLAARYLATLLEGNRRAAIKLVIDATASGLAPLEAFEQVLEPVQRELGRMWLAGEIHVGEEHFATATTLQVMALVSAHAVASMPEPSGKRVLAAAVDGNLHELGVRMIADVFELEGWSSIYLGASIPAPDLAQSVRDFGVDLIALSVALPVQLGSARDTIAHLRADPELAPIPIILGGGGLLELPDAWRSLGADGFARTAREAVELGRTLTGSQGPG